MTRRQPSGRKVRFLLSVIFAAACTQANADAMRWQTFEESSITFVAMQAGAPFEGRFDRFEADIRFAPDALEGSTFSVRIELDSVSTDYGERDEILRGADFFDVGVHPFAVYEASQFTELGQGEYRAQGSLLINGKKVPTDVMFTFSPAEDDSAVQILAGGAAINRLDFDLGLGDWRDDKWVGHEVRISFRLRLGVSPDFPIDANGGIISGN